MSLGRSAVALGLVAASLGLASRVLADAPAAAPGLATANDAGAAPSSPTAPSADAAPSDSVSLGAVTVVTPDAAAPDAGLAPTSSLDGGAMPANNDAGAAKKKDRFVRVGQSVEDFMERDFTWDANLEGALGPGFVEQGKPQVLGFGRVRVGAMFIAAPNFFSLGATYEFSNKSFATFGLQLEYMHLISGGWVQIGPLFDAQHPRPGFSLAAGWATFGVELQQRAYEGLGQTTAIFGKVRFPVGVFVWALTNKQHSQPPQQGESLLPYSPLRF